MAGSSGSAASDPPCASCTRRNTPPWNNSMAGVRRASATGSPSVPRSSKALAPVRAKVAAMDSAYSGWV
jgi:hypothetical protein